MAKNILASIICILLLSVGGVTTILAKPAIEIIDQDFQTETISISGNVLRVSGAEDEMLYIYNVTGVRVMSIKVDGSDKRFTLNLPKGCYIVKVGKVVRKVSIR